MSDRRIAAVPADLLRAPAAVTKAAEEHAALNARLSEAARAVRTLRDGKHAAKVADEVAAAESFRAGKPAPGPVHVTKHAEALAEAEALQAAGIRATSEAYTRLRAAVEDHAAEWSVELADEATDADADLLAALDAASAALARRDRVRLVRRWITDDGVKASSRALAPIANAVALRVIPGTPVLAGDLLDALAATVTPPARTAADEDELLAAVNGA